MPMESTLEPIMMKPLTTNLDCFWYPGPITPTISPQEAHVWVAPLHALISQVDELRQCLSLDELERARRYRSVGHQNRFIISRGILRIILGRYINKPPEQLHFDYGCYGKPVLLQDSGPNDIQFNLSHSHDYAVYSIAPNARLGIDLEYIHPFSEIRQLANRFFDPEEKNAFFTLPLEQQTDAFFRYWTQTEAYIKAKGQSLSYAFDHPTINIGAERSNSLGSANTDSENTSNRSLYQFSPAPNYTASLVIEGNNWQVSCWKYMAFEFVHTQHAT